MKKIQLFLMLIFAVFYASAQRPASSTSFSVTIKNCDNTEVTHNKSAKELQANFKADKTYGGAPLTVRFTDRSQGVVTKYEWRFGDGSVDTVKNPVHVYQQPGIYTVKLRIWDADSASSLASKPDLIRVAGYGSCDSLNYRIPGAYYLYRVAAPDHGYLSGNNSRGDLAKATLYQVNEDKGLLMGGVFDFAWATRSLSNDVPVVFKIWDDDGVDNSPGTLLDEATVPLSQIVFDAENHLSTIVFFDHWTPIQSDFFMGFEMPQIAGDTIALFTNKITALQQSDSWEQTSAGAWRTYQQGNPGLDVNHAMYPVICKATGIANDLLSQDILVYPVPAKERIYVSVFNPDIKNLKLQLLDVSGRIVNCNITQLSTGYLIDIHQLKSGIYFLKIQSGEDVSIRKIVVE
ncbi:MAG: PKD domain-containing protein [Bacteroidales bacterium]|jgi:PKD repeat protein|nr:PKD domain-containing protein [Bacteroidales bacterium]MDY0333489.1 PKD domain-containing protein [Bacteroidales bacterium]